MIAVNLLLQYRVIEGRPIGVQAQNGKLVLRWMETWTNEDGQLCEEPLPDKLTVLQRINQLALDGWRIIGIVPGAWWLERRLT